MQYIPANSHSSGVSLALLMIKYGLTPDFSKKAKSHSFSTVSLLNCVTLDLFVSSHFVPA